MNPFTFENQKLEVDYLTFAIPETDENLKKKDDILFELQKLNFHSTKNENKTDFKVTVKHQWKRILFMFAGINACEVYRLAKLKKLNLKTIFMGPVSLSRFDLCLSKCQDDYVLAETFEDFIRQLKEDIKDNTRTKFVRIGEDEDIIKVNRRTNSQYFRIYKNDLDNIIRYELELKKKSVDPIQTHFFDNDFEQLELIATKMYFKISKRLFRYSCNSIYLFWLVDFERRYNKNKLKPENMLETTYLANQIFNKTEFYNLIQFLAFTKTLEKSNTDKHVLAGKTFTILEFELKHFMLFIGVTNQRNKVIGYFKNLQNSKPVLESFNDKSFQLYVTFPFVESFKRSNKWFIKIYILNDLLYFNFPFKLPDSFLKFSNKPELIIKSQILKSLTVNSIEKSFCIKEFFASINVSNSKIILSKQTLIKLFFELQQQKYILPEITLVYKNLKSKPLIISISELEPNQINRRISYFKFREHIFI